MRETKNRLRSMLSHQRAVSAENANLAADLSEELAQLKQKHAALVNATAKYQPIMWGVGALLGKPERESDRWPDWPKQWGEARAERDKAVAKLAAMEKQVRKMMLVLHPGTVIVEDI